MEHDGHSSVNFSLQKLANHEHELFWMNYVDLACFFTGPIQNLITQNSDKSVEFYLVNYDEQIVACFAVRRNLIYNVAYKRTISGITVALLKYLIKK